MPKATWKGAVLAESDKCEQVEGNCYFPPDSLRREYFTDSSTTSMCSWKGKCDYFNVKVGDEVNQDAAWVYREPYAAAKNIKNYVAFWKGVEVSS
jgi:uncharacterized protein (DUF427 family)